MAWKQTDPLFDGHEAGELRQYGELFAQIDDEGLQVCFFTLKTQKQEFQ